MKACSSRSLRSALQTTSFAALVALAVPSARATDYLGPTNATGNPTYSWATPTTFTPNGTPGASDTVTIGTITGTAATAQSEVLTLDGSRTVTSFSYDNLAADTGNIARTLDLEAGNAASTLTVTNFNLDSAAIGSSQSTSVRGVFFGVASSTYKLTTSITNLNSSGGEID